MYGLAASGVVGLAAVLAVFALAGGGSSGGDPAKVAAAMESAGCTLTSTPAQRNEPDHSDVPTPDTKVEWNTHPPTSGPHYGVPAVYGAYTEPIELTRVVHNLEHGAVYILYGEDVPAATVEELRAFYDRHRNGTLLAPLPDLGEEIALGAWVVPDPASGDRGRGYLATCTAFDETAFSAFFSGFQFKGPERFSPDAMRPGST